MTYEEKKEWLRRYSKAAKLEKIKLEEVERYRTDAEHITQVLSLFPAALVTVRRCPALWSASRMQCRQPTRR